MMTEAGTYIELGLKVLQLRTDSFSHSFLFTPTDEDVLLRELLKRKRERSRASSVHVSLRHDGEYREVTIR